MIYKLGELVEVSRVQSVDDGWQSAVRALIGIQGRVIAARCVHHAGKALTRYRIDGVAMWIRHECLDSHGAPATVEIAEAAARSVELELFPTDVDAYEAWAEAFNRSNNKGYLIKSIPVPDEPDFVESTDDDESDDDDEDDEEFDDADEEDFDF